MKHMVNPMIVCALLVGLAPAGETVTIEYGDAKTTSNRKPDPEGVLLIPPLLNLEK